MFVSLIDDMARIPVIDFAKFPKIDGNKDVDRSDILNKLGKELKTAFETVGFCYIKNHGIDESLLDKHYNVSRRFFSQPVETKEKYARGDTKSGWVAPESETFIPTRPAGYRESFKYYPIDDVTATWGPDMADFRDSIKVMVNQCTELATRILTALSVGLELEPGFLAKSHTRIDHYSLLKSSFYPPITDDSLIKPNQIRIGEHSDFGTLTILFQDDQGGLEIEVPGQGFIPATPIPGTAVLNIGDMMQRWSADKLVAAKHRVIIPEAEIKRRSFRQSTAFFVYPDDDVIIKCLDGSDKYAEITAFDYLNQQIDALFNGVPS